MGTSRSAAELSKKMTTAARSIETSRKAGLTAAAQVTKVAFLSAPGAPHRVAGRKVSVSYRVGRDTALVRWNGPVHLVNNPTKGHAILPKGVSGRRRRGRAPSRALGGALAAAAGHPVASAQHPGTRGKHFFEKGREVARKAVPPIYHSHVHKSMGKVFGA